MTALIADPNRIATVCLLLAVAGIGAAGLAAAAKPNEVQVAVLVNQVGYDLSARKVLAVETRDGVPHALNSFNLVNQAGKPIYQGKLVRHGRILGESASDWGVGYRTGELTGFRAPGMFRVRAPLESGDVSPFPFRIGRRKVVAGPSAAAPDSAAGI